MLKKIESFLLRRIEQLEKAATVADPRASKDYDDQADCFKEVLAYVQGLKPPELTVDLADHFKGAGMSEMLDLVSKYRSQKS